MDGNVAEEVMVSFPERKGRGWGSGRHKLDEFFLIQNSVSLGMCSGFAPLQLSEADINVRRRCCRRPQFLLTKHSSCRQPEEP